MPSLIGGTSATAESFEAATPVASSVAAPSVAVAVAPLLFATSGRVTGVELSIPVDWIGSVEASFAVVVGSIAAGSAALVGVWTSGIDMAAKKSSVEGAVNFSVKTPRVDPK